MATHFSILAWRIPWTEESGRLQFEVKVIQSCPTLRPHGPYSPWNLQARVLEWVTFPSSRGSSQPRDRTQVSQVAGGFFIR